MKRRLVPRPTLLLYSALFATSVSCTDSPTAINSSNLLGVPGAGSATISDPELNLNDTWVSSTATIADTTVVTSNEPFTDPATNQQTTTLSWASNPTAVEVLAGYGHSGELRVTTGYATDNPAETQVVQQIGDATGDVDQTGTASTEPLEIEPTADLGTLQDAQVDPSPPPDPACPRSETAGCASTGAGLVAGDSRPMIVLRDALRLTTVQSFKGFSRLNRPRRETSPSANLEIPVGLPTVQHESKITRNYEKRADKWLLRHVLNEEKIKGPHSTLERRQHFDFARLEYFQNRVLDAARTARRAALDTSAVLPRSSLAVVRPNVLIGGKHLRGVLSSCDPEADPTCCPETADKCDPPPDGGGGGGSSEPPPPNETVGTGADYSETSDGGYTTIVFQHGFFSSAETFARMSAWVNTDMLVAGRMRKSLNWRNTYEDQAAELHEKLRTDVSPLSTDAVLIGHSNGGMISRYLARHPAAHNEIVGTPYYDPIPIRGVITIGTPHLGTPMARHAPTVNRIFGVAGGTAFVLCWYTQGAGCRQVLQITTSGAERRFKALLDSWPVVNEMQPRSSYHDAFNSQPESFLRFGIQSYTWRKWQLWRIWGDSFCYPRSDCGGYKRVKKADRTYHHDVSCSVVGLFTGRWARAAGCAADGAFLQLFDLLYRKYSEPVAVANDEYGDGWVPGWSQRYPNIPAQNQFAIHDGPSHTGETKDECVGKAVEGILVDWLGVPRKGTPWLCL